MTYADKLHPWCIIRTLSNCQNLMIARFRSRGEATNYLNALQRLIPDGTFTIIFEMVKETTFVEDN
ncbi:hypothetical protein DSM106972_047760 [Dulcicalothrix desertica PCC 7102]|uniref:DUF1330 domain-containing protein n=1 Tax=Dulcicalothrix desertica PCC 7102 TaxID=232991 RepID=A0A3S1D5F4_9CYAN|nr:hypothetical protein [Dulcicalothrix desertica]RUT03862.1 hypothetical protein DSM106972_047760 [Dulcicalothrix desertica PCC 7102]TWH43727.1 hypothetical protein CAL7102_07471 [Dulcicalothrix desertica PCC 7102]